MTDENYFLYILSKLKNSCVVASILNHYKIRCNNPYGKSKFDISFLYFSNGISSSFKLL